MSYNGPPPSYTEAAAMPKLNTGIIPGHVLQTPLGPIQPHLDQMKPAPGEFRNSLANPYAPPKQRPSSPTNDSYPSDVKVPYSQTSQLESGPYPSGTLQYSRNVGTGASYQSPPNSNIGSGAPPGYQGMPSPRMPSHPVGAGANPGIYPSVGYEPPYPTDTFERGMNQTGAPPGYGMPRPSQPGYNRSSSPPLAGRIDHMNISGSPNNFPPGPRSNSPYSQNPTYPPNIGGGASYQSSPNSSIRSGTGYQNSPSPMIGSGAARGYSSSPIGQGTNPGYSGPMIGGGTSPGYSGPTIGSGTSPGYSGPMIGSGTSPGYSGPMIGGGTSPGYSSPRIGSGTSLGYSGPMIGSGARGYSPPRGGGYPSPRTYGPPMIGGGYSSGSGGGYGSGSCTSVPSSHGGYCPTTNYCGKKPHHSHHHHHC